MGAKPHAPRRLPVIDTLTFAPHSLLLPSFLPYFFFFTSSLPGKSYWFTHTAGPSTQWAVLYFKFSLLLPAGRSAKGVPLPARRNVFYLIRGHGNCTPIRTAHARALSRINLSFFFFLILIYIPTVLNSRGLKNKTIDFYG